MFQYKGKINGIEITVKFEQEMTKDEVLQVAEMTLQNQHKRGEL